MILEQDLVALLLLTYCGLFTGSSEQMHKLCTHNKDMWVLCLHLWFIFVYIAWFYGVYVSKHHGDSLRLFYFILVLNFLWFSTFNDQIKTRSIVIAGCIALAVSGQIAITCEWVFLSPLILTMAGFMTWMALPKSTRDRIYWVSLKDCW